MSVVVVGCASLSRVLALFRCCVLQGREHNLVLPIVERTDDRTCRREYRGTRALDLMRDPSRVRPLRPTMMRGDAMCVPPSQQGEGKRRREREKKTVAQTSIHCRRRRRSHGGGNRVHKTHKKRRVARGLCVI